MLPEFKDIERLLHAASYRYYRRIVRSGVHSVTIEDVFQETCIAFCYARDHYKPEIEGPDGQIKHVPFAAFLRLGIRHHLNHWIAKEIVQVDDRMELDADYSAAEEGESTGHDFIADTKVVSAETKVIEQTTLEKFEANLGPHARQFLEILRDPPPALLAAVQAMRSRRDFAIARGLASAPVVGHVQASLVFDLMGIGNRLARTRIYGEIKELINLRTGINLNRRTGINLNG